MRLSFALYCLTNCTRCLRPIAIALEYAEKGNEEENKNLTKKSVIIEKNIEDKEEIRSWIRALLIFNYTVRIEYRNVTYLHFGFCSRRTIALAVAHT